MLREKLESPQAVTEVLGHQHLAQQLHAHKGHCAGILLAVRFRITEPAAWERWWKDPSCRQYYFIGKDNIPFHTVIWPAILLGRGDVILPYDVPANEYMNMGGQKASKSAGVGSTVPPCP